MEEKRGEERGETQFLFLFPLQSQLLAVDFNRMPQTLTLFFSAVKHVS